MRRRERRTVSGRATERRAREVSAGGGPDTGTVIRCTVEGSAMRTFDQMLRELARTDVIEFAVASDRLPCAKVGSKYEPVDDAPRPTGQIVEMLAAWGGGDLVKDLERNPAHWTTRIDGVGSVGVQAVMLSGRVQARFAVIVRDTSPAPERAPANKPDAARPVLMRVAGELLPRGAPVHEVAVEKMIAAIVPDRMRSTLTEQGSCDFALDRGVLGRFRVNVSRQRTGLKACF